jgi:hypothetical protein
LPGAEEAEFLDVPPFVVLLDEGPGRDAHLLGVVEDVAVDGLFLQRAIEAFRDPVGLGLGDEGEGRGNSRSAP